MTPSTMIFRSSWCLLQGWAATQTCRVWKHTSLHATDLLPSSAPSPDPPWPHSPTDDLLVLGSDVVLLFGCQDAKGELLPGAALPVHNVRTLVHVDGALWQGGGLGRKSKGQ